MSPSEFLRLADETLDAIETAVGQVADTSDVDIEASRSGNVVTIEFDDGSKIIVNSQEPMQEIWVAARSGGFHFRRDGERWIDTRDGSELFAALSRYAALHAGQSVVLRP